MFHHVKGHQDSEKKFSAFDCESQYNVLFDEHAIKALENKDE